MVWSTLRPSARRAVAVATAWDSAISAAPSCSTCFSLESGAYTCSSGTTSSDPDSHAPTRS